MNEAKIESYINMESNVQKKKGLLSFWWIMIIVCIPSAIFGEYADITKYIVLPLVVIMSLWIIYLLINTDSKKIQYILFLGIFSVFISISFLIAAYKIAVTETSVSFIYVFILILAYILSNIMGIVNTLRLIERGYFLTQRKMENPMGIIFAAGLLGLGIGRTLLGNTSQDIVVTVLVVGLIFLGFLFSMGSHNLLKYYLAKRYR